VGSAGSVIVSSFWSHTKKVGNIYIP